jgi:L-seryl-tRNA(Ser) seleniumtransferase
LGDRSAKLRSLPRVDEVLAHPLMQVASEGAPRALAREAAREAVEEARAQIAGGSSADDVTAEAVSARAAEILQQKRRPSLRRAINATGVILHTGLGRAPLSQVAREALAEAAGYANIQADVGSGERMAREVHVADLFRQIVGADGVLVVNNNAAATVLALNTLAAGREVIVSRGEMVEIGGAFRIPDIIALSGCRLVEVGCTNRTHLRDYEKAITAETALLLVVHQSNYRITGFASQPELDEVAALAHARGLLCAHDLGSGALLDLRQLGLPHEPSVPESLAAGADVVFFSGDKLLGGPQCGVMLGKADLLERMHRNPYYRTFRVDKLTLAALEATLRLYLEPERLPEKHMVTALLTLPVAAIRARGETLAERLRQECGGWLQVAVAEGVSEIGGGSLAGHTLPTIVVKLSSAKQVTGELAARLRQSEPPIFARVHEGAVLLDLRTVLPEEDELIAAALQRLRPPAAASAA